MNPSKHLSKDHIAAFAAGDLAVPESRIIGGHLLRCVECRRLLPIPDRGKFWNALMSEHGSEQSTLSRESVFSTQSHSHTFVGIFSKPSGFAWSGGLLVVILGLALAILFTVSKKPNVESEVAKSFEVENPVSILSHIQSEGGITPLPDGTVRNGREGQPRDRESARRRLTEARPKQNAKVPRGNGGGTARPVRGDVSSTRGAKSICGAERTFEMELGFNKTELVLKWQRVPNAAKYHLYVSDDDEILIDDFETENATSYLLNKQLDPKKTYKWKVLITLENGQVIAADSQKFTAADIGSVQKKTPSKRQRSVTRCSENR